MDQTPDLFGQLPAPLHTERAVARRRDARTAGYAGPPGRGPAGETCSSCSHLVRFKQSKSWCKCNLLRHAWTAGRRTDVLARSPACPSWQPNPADPHARA
jgi:hypothetical protein